MAQVPCTVSMEGESDRTMTMEEFFKTDWTTEAEVVGLEFDTELAAELVSNFKKVDL